MITTLLLAAVGSLVGPPHVVVPPENAAHGELPSLATAETLAKELLAAFAASEPASVAHHFFPKAEFTKLKDIPRPCEYHAKLVGWYEADLAREIARVRDLGPLAYDGFKRGGCKWKAKGTEANRIAYWSCYRNHFFARSEKNPNERLKFELRAMINWGTTWYVTHLGPIP